MGFHHKVIFGSVSNSDTESLEGSVRVIFFCIVITIFKCIIRHDLKCKEPSFLVYVLNTHKYDLITDWQVLEILVTSLKLAKDVKYIRLITLSVEELSILADKDHW